MHPSTPHLPGYVAWSTACVLGLVVQPVLGVAAIRDGGGALEILVNLTLMTQPLVAAVIISRVPVNPIGWLLLVGAVGGQSGMLANRLSTTWSVTGLGAGWLAVAEDLTFILVAASLATLLLVFPTGRTMGKLGRVGVGSVAVAVCLGLIMVLFAPFASGSHPGTEHPVGWDVLNPSALLGGTALVTTLAMLGLGLLSGLTTMWRRWRSGDDQVRGQLALTGWCAGVGISMMLGLAVADSMVDVPSSVEQLSPAPLVIGLPVAVGVAVLRHKLLDMRVLVNRTLTYAGLSIVLFGAYLGLVGLLGTLLVGDSELVPPVLAAGMISLVAHPTHRRLREMAGRRLFGDRGDPYTAVTRLQRAVALRGTPSDVAGSAVQGIASILRVPHVRLELSSGVSVVEGEPGPPEMDIDLRYGGRTLGTLIVATRSHRERFTHEEKLLVDHLARQTAAAIGAAQLAAELRISHGRLSAAVADERQRLLRDLHDDLGPRLTGIRYTIEAAKARADPDGAALLERAGIETKEAVNRVRLIARDLRPPELDAYGLQGALSIAADRVRSAGLDMTVDLPDEDPSVRPEVEAAILRIAEEALTNVLRHAAARHCSLALRTGSDLELSVVDDGQGLAPGFASGIGLQSMRERASGAGGTFSIGAAPRGSGVQVLATFPVGDEG